MKCGWNVNEMWMIATLTSFDIANASVGSGHRAAAAALTGLGGSLCANGPDVVKAALTELGGCRELLRYV